MEKLKETKAGQNYSPRCFLLLLCSMLFAGLGMGWQGKRANPGVSLMVEDVRNGEGLLRIALFAGANGFPGEKEKAYKLLSVPAQKGAVMVDIKDLPAGTYALIILHDENKNGEMDTNFVGYPKEGYGASNNQLPMFRAPNFEEAAFTVNQPEQSLRIRIRY